MGYEADPETDGMFDNIEESLRGMSNSEDRLNPTRRIERNRLAQLGNIGHKDDRKRKEEEEAMDAFLERMEAAARRANEVDGYELPRVDANHKILGGAGIIVTAGAAQSLFGNWLKVDGIHADNDDELTLEANEAA